MSKFLSDTENAIVELGRMLREVGYTFTTVTPATHGLVMKRKASSRAMTLRDVFGWSSPFTYGDLPAAIIGALQRGGLIREEENGELRTLIRFSSLGPDLFAHSAYPTVEQDAVFFGPDTYRFARLIRSALQGRTVKKPSPVIVDIGCGSGAGGIHAARQIAGPSRTVLADISVRALAFARANAVLASLQDIKITRSDLFAEIEKADIILSNPPYLVDPQHRIYRDGGGELGSELSVRIVREGLLKLEPGGMLILYTGVPIIDGQDLFLRTSAPALDASGCQWTYEELDPDVFGEELARDVYSAADRIAAVGLVVQKALLQE